MHNRTLLVIIIIATALAPLSAVLGGSSSSDDDNEVSPLLLQEQACTLCKGGAAIGLPEKLISLPGFTSWETCRELNDSIPLLLRASDKLCGQVQSFGSLCGCPLDDEHEACHLCGSINHTVQNKQKQVPLFQDQFPPGITPTCELLEAYLVSLPSTDGLCGVSQAFLSSHCECSTSDTSVSSSASTPTNATRQDDDEEDEESLPSSSSPTPCSLCANGGNMTMPDAPTYLGFEGFETCQALEDAVKVLFSTDHPYCEPIQMLGPNCGCPTVLDGPACTMCTDNTDVPFPDRVIPFLDGGSFFGGDSSHIGGLSLNVTCGLYESYVKTLAKDDEMCGMAQSISSYCGCPVLENHCQFCANGERVPQEYLDKRLNFLAASIASDDNSAGSGKAGPGTSSLLPTCEFVETLMFQIPKRTDACLMRHRSWLCGCNNGESDFAGMRTYTQKVFMIWGPRVSSLLSLLGSAAIAIDIFTSQERRRHIYCRLVLGVVFFDVVTAIGFIFSSLPMPTMVDGDPLGVFGARGNMTLCRLQGIVVFFGYGTIMYTISLCLYYTLVIVHKWPERRLKKVERWLHGVPILLSVGLAFSTIPYTGPNGFACTVRTSPWSQHKWSFSIIVGLPVYGGTTVMTYLLVRIFLKVRADERRAHKWRFGHRSEAGSTEQAALSSNQFENELDSMEKVHSFKSGNVKTSRASQNMLSLPEDDFLEATNRTEATQGAALHQQMQRQQQRLRQQQKRGRHIATRQQPSLERKVFWQCLKYFLAFILVYPLSIALAYYTAMRDEVSMPLGIIVAWLAPLQGLADCWVYFGPRIDWRCCRSQQQRRAPEKTTVSSKKRSSFAKEVSVDSLRVEWDPSLQNEDGTLSMETDQAYEDPSMAVLNLRLNV